MEASKDRDYINNRINRMIETFEKLHNRKLNITIYNGDKSKDGKEWEGDKVLLEIGEKLSFNIIKKYGRKKTKKLMEHIIIVFNNIDFS